MRWNVPFDKVEGSFREDEIFLITSHHFIFVLIVASCLPFHLFHAFFLSFFLTFFLSFFLSFYWTFLFSFGIFTHIFSYIFYILLYFLQLYLIIYSNITASFTTLFNPIDLVCNRTWWSSYNSQPSLSHCESNS